MEKKQLDDLLVLLGFGGIFGGKINRISIEDVDENNPVAQMFDTGGNIKVIGKGLMKKRFIVDCPRYHDKSESPDYIDSHLIEIRYSFFRLLALGIAHLLRVR